MTRPAEWAVAIGGGLALAAVLVWVVRGRDAAPIAVVLAPPPAVINVPPPAPPPPAPPAAAITDSGEYRLRGALARPGGDGSAIIETADGKQRLVREGRDLVPGVRLEVVSHDGVVLMRGGSRLEIRLDKREP